MLHSAAFAELNVEAIQSTWKAPYLTVFGIGICEFLLSSVFFSYGIFLNKLIQNGTYTYGYGLWTTIFLFCIKNLVDPWSRSLCEYFDDYGIQKHRETVISSVLGVVLSMLLCTYFEAAPFQILGNGICFGILNSIVSNQIRNVTYDLFESQPKAYEAIIQVSRALALLVFPELSNCLIEFYGVNGAQFILAAITLHIIPAVLIVKFKKAGPRGISIVASYADLSHMSGLTSIQMNELPKNKRMFKEEFPRIATYSCVSKNDFPTTFDTESFAAHLPIEITRRSSIFSLQASFEDKEVVIMPRVTEIKDILDREVESEIFTKGSLALAKEESLTNIPIDMEHKSKSATLVENENYFDADEDFPTDDNIYLTSTESNSFCLLEKLKCYCCSSYTRFRWNLKLYNAIDLITDTFLFPLYISLLDPHFYVVLFSKVVNGLWPVIIITLIPYLAVKYGTKENIEAGEDGAAFIMSVMSFSWGFFLIALPILMKMSKLKTQGIFILGMCLMGTCLTFLKYAMSYGAITLISIMYGFAYGIMAYSEETSYREFIGVTQWRQTQGTLDSLSAIITCVVYYIIYAYMNQLQSILFVAFITYFCNVILFLTVPIIKLGYVSLFPARVSENNL